MKVACSHCGKDISKEVQSQMANYQVGKIVCPHCHKQNKRYISMYDLFLNVMGSMVIYGIVLSGMYLMMVANQQEKITIVVALVVTVLAFVVVVWGVSRWSTYVYQTAPGKQKWANVTIKEDPIFAAKSAKRSFYAFLAMVFLLGFMTMFINYAYYILGVLVFLLLMAWKLRQAYITEKVYYQKTFEKK